MDSRYVNARIVGYLLSNPRFVTLLNDVFHWYDQATQDLLTNKGAPHVSLDIQIKLMSKRVTEFLRPICIHSQPAFVTSIHVEASMTSHVHVSPPRQILIDGRPMLVWKAEVHESLHLVVRRGIQIGRGQELSSGTYEYSHRFLMDTDAGDKACAEDEAAEDEAVEDLVDFIGVNFRCLLRGGSEVEAARGGSDEDSISDDNYEDAAANLAPLSTSGRVYEVRASLGDANADQIKQGTFYGAGGPTPTEQ